MDVRRALLGSLVVAALAAFFSPTPARATPFVWEPSLGAPIAPNLNDGLELNTFAGLGFSFPFAGTTYSGSQQLAISTNGFVTLGGNAGAGCCDGNPAALASSAFATIAPFWADLDPEVGGDVRRAQLQDDGDPETDRMVVTWNVALHDCNSSMECRARAQLQLLGDGTIVFAYDGVDLVEDDTPGSVDDDVLAGLGAGGESSLPPSADLSALPVDTGSRRTLFELFVGNPPAFDLDGRSLVFTPNGAGGFRVSSGTTAPPAVTGTAREGQTLTAGTGTWLGSPTSFAYQWQRCDAVGSGCAAIAGATAATYAAGPADIDSTLRVAVTATNGNGTATDTSPPSGVVLPAAPANAKPPEILGTTEKGQRLAAVAGTWTSSRPLGFSYQWQRCDLTGGACADVPGAVRQTYALGPDDVRTTLRVVVTASSAGGTTAATSARTRLVCTIVGSARADVLTGTKGRDVICGLGGNDILTGLAGDDVLVGGPGKDRITGGLGRDEIQGEAGNDTLTGGEDRDVIAGGLGDDVILARDKKRDTLDGGEGSDRALVDRKDVVAAVEALS